MDSCCSLVFKDQDFVPHRWRELLICGNETARTKVDRMNSGGRLDGPFRQHIQQWGKAQVSEQDATCIVGHLNVQATFKPAERGSITSFDFDCSIRNIESPTDIQYAMLVEQNNKVYISNVLTTNNEKWTMFSLHNLKRADFRRLSTNTKDTLREEFPNFTFRGGDLRFGYAIIYRTSQSQDQVASGIDFWRVTVFHENAREATQNMRVLQLEHNSNILMQELSDMHEHADVTRREHATQISALHTAQEDLAREREIVSFLRRKLDAQSQALQLAHAEVENLQEAIASVDEKDESSELTELRAVLQEERAAIAELSKEKEELMRSLKIQKDEVQNLIGENEVLDASNAKLRKTVVKLTSELNEVHDDHEQVSNLLNTTQQALADATDTKMRMEELLSMEKNRREEVERQLASSATTLKGELKSLATRMEADVAHERSLRLQLENSHRAEISRIEAETRAEKSRMEEFLRSERMSYLQKEAALLEEKRNMATSLQAATTKSALLEKRLSNQLLSINALHMSEVEKIAQLEEELRMEKEARSQLESKEDEDWEVVDDQ